MTRLRFILSICLAYLFHYGSLSAQIINLQKQSVADTAAPESYLNEQFADRYLIDINLLDQAQIIEHNNTAEITLSLTYPSANAICFFFSEYIIPPNAHLTIKGDKQSVNYSAQRYSHSLATNPIYGDTIRLTLIVQSDQISQCKLRLSSFGVTEADAINQNSRLKSSDCNIDVNCTEGLAWEKIKNSVCKLTINNSVNCTGTLINNTNRDGRQYVLTANHCISDSLSALNTVFVFNYEMEVCEGTELAPNFSVSGAKLLATSRDQSVDFALLEILDSIPSEADIFYAGWDLSSDQKTDAFTIHHPNGNTKKISKSYDAPITDWFVDSRLSYDLVENSHWKVAEWEYGVTLSGSSGAALFNEEGLIIGSLTGGDAYCGYPYDDFFQKIEYSWDYFKDSSQQLKYWLDPLSTGQTSLRGKGNGTQCSTNSQDYLVLSHPDCENGYIFGTNCNSVTRFGMEFKESGKFLTGTGFYIAQNSLSSTDSIYLKIYNASNFTIVKTYAIAGNSLVPEAYNKLIFPDSINTAGDYIICLEVPQSELGSFSVYSTRADQYCEQLHYFNDSTWLSGKDLAMHIEIPICAYSTDILFDIPSKLKIEHLNLFEATYQKAVYSEDSILLYPNPSISGRISIKLQGQLNDDIKLRLFDMRGIEVFDFNRSLTQHGNNLNIEISNLSPGSYLLQVHTKGKILTRWFSYLK